MAVKKAVADCFVKRRWCIDDHPQISLIRDCSDAARRNLRLGKWLSSISPAGKLLLPDLHHIFNAATILMLHQIVFVNLRTNDVSDIAFAIASFEQEASTGSNYGKDCAKVLKDLSALVQRLRNLMFSCGADSKTSSPYMPGEQILTSLSSSSMASSFGPTMADAGAHHAGATHLQVSHAENPLYQELTTWIDNDNMQFYNNFLL